jgi:capsular exopolysaccharide synthesis family protein
MAIAIAQSGKRTLLIDNDLRRPRVHKAVGIENTIGLADVLAKQVTVDEAVHETEIENLYVMSAGHIPPNPTELLHTERFGHVLDELREKYDRVIFDSPPIGAVADALILSQTVDAVLLVLKFGQTRKDILKRSIEQLEGIGAPLIGCVLNDIKREAGYGYQYYYYHRYGYDDRPGDDDKKIKKLRAS